MIIITLGAAIAEENSFDKKTNYDDVLDNYQLILNNYVGGEEQTDV
jgi:hypothetical protein